jgi:hypothetical protein
MRFRTFVALGAAVLTMGAPPARAAPAKAGKAASPAAKVAKAPPPGPKLLRLEEMKVEGRIHKPQAMFLLPRATLNPGDLDRTEPLSPKVTAAVEREPF